MIAEFYEGNDALIRDEACRSISFAAMNLMLTAQDRGFESCPLISFEPAQVSDILGLDPSHPPLLMVVIGKGTKDPHPRFGFQSFEEQISVDHFGNHALTGEIEA